MTVPHYGKRRAGALTAASPGDTLYFQFASYNDSGDSEAATGFAVTDIEVFKNGLAATRATDSGYSLISDTGQIGDRVGLYRFSLQLFNTADDTGHYESGAWYQVAVDSVTIDGKTVRMWVGSFEIGEPRANVVQLAGDTGAANYLKNTFAAGFADTGINDRLGRILADTDTGIQSGVNVTSFADTGVNDRLARILADTDTGIQSAVNVFQIRGDTGAADRFFRYTQKLDTGGDATVSASVDTGQVNNAVWNGARSAHTTAGTFGEYVLADMVRIDGDTGSADVLAKATNGVGGVSFSAGIAVNSLVAAALASITDAVWDESDTGHADTGTFGRLRRAVNIGKIRGDTGSADRFFRYTQKLDTGGDATVSASVDTGQVNNAVWNGARSAHTTAGSFGQYVNANLVAVLTDTGAAHLDAGRLGVSAAATVDTGQVNQAVWQANAVRGITAISDTGMNERFGRIQSDVDTGLRVHIDDLDTGLHAHISDVDTGIHSILQTVGVLVIAFSDTGVNNRLSVIAADTDTGIQSSVNVTAFADTGINSRLAIILADTDTGIQSGVSMTQIRGDTGAADRLLKLAGSQLKTDGTFDTGTGQTTNTFNITATATTDTGQVANAVWNSARSAHATAGTFGQFVTANMDLIDGDTGAATHLQQAAAASSSITANATQLGGDTGALNWLRQTFASGFADTGLNSRFAQVTVTGFSDTGVNDRLGKILADTDTGIQSGVTVTAFSDTGVNNRLAVIAADTDTGIQSSVTATNVTGFADTGVNARLAAITTKTDSLTFTVAGVVDANIQRVNDVNITGTGDTGTGDTWRPA